jgi:hypothetical protein
MSRAFWGIIIVVGLALWAGACLPQDPEETLYACRSDADCLEAFFCEVDHICRPRVAPDAGVTDGGTADGGD